MNLFRKKILVVLLVLIFILAGCTKTKDNQPAESKPPETSGAVSSPDAEKEQDKDIKEAPIDNVTEENGKSQADDDEDETVFEVKDSKYINEWKELTLKDYAYTTEDWESYSFQENSPLIAFSLHFPGNWDIQYSVFTDEKGEKVAELFPPIMMSADQSLLDNWESNNDCELVSMEDIKVGDLTGIRVVVKAYPHGGDILEWYPHTYYLTDEKRVFAMSFYALELDAEKQKQFDRVIDTFEFID